MPARQPARPTWRPRVPTLLYAHPFELGLGAAFVVLGLKGLVAGASSPSVDALPDVALILYRVAEFVAGVGILVGLIVRESALGRAVERAACYVLGSALLAFALLLVGRNGSTAWDVGLVCVFIGAACILRAIAIRKAEKIIRRTLADLRADPVALRRLVDGRPPIDPTASEKEGRSE